MHSLYTSSRLFWLDIVRIVALLMVVWSHVLPTIGIHAGLDWGWIGGIYQVTIGNLGVTLFIILSGIVLELRYGQVPVIWNEFLTKRLTHIYGIYWPALAVAYAYKRMSSPLEKISLDDWGCSLTGTCAFFHKWGGPIIPTGWFIGVIVSLYVLYPFISRSIKKSAFFTLTSLFIVAIVTRRYMSLEIPQAVPLDVHWHPLARAFEFAVGIYIARICPSSFWMGLWTPFKLKPFISFSAAVTFPLFLIHYPLISLITLMQPYLGLTLTLVAYFFIVVSLSLFMLLVEKPLQRLFHEFHFYLHTMLLRYIPE